MSFRPEKVEQTYEKKEYTPDPNYLKILVSKEQVPEQFKEQDYLTYNFSLVPFVETEYLEWNTLPKSGWTESTKSYTKKEKNILSNYIHNDKAQTDLILSRAKYLKDVTFFGNSSMGGITDPYHSYKSKTWNEFKDTAYYLKVDKSFLTSVYIHNDPIDPSNNGTIKILKMKYSLFNTIKEKVKEYIDEYKIDNFNIFNPSSATSFKLKIKLSTKGVKTDSQNTYTNVTLINDITPIRYTRDNLFSLKDIINESKQRYVSRNLRNNLTSLGWSEEKIFEYQAFADLFNYIKDDKNKLVVFNQINKYNLDPNLFVQENYTPTNSLIKSANDLEVNESVSSRVSNFDNKPQNNVSGHIYSLDELDDIPF